MIQEYRKVLRGFDGNGLRYESGDVVETSTWKHAGKLIATRYLSSFTIKESEKPLTPQAQEPKVEKPEADEPKVQVPRKTTATKKVAKPTTDVE